MNELDYIQEHLDEIQRDIDEAYNELSRAKEYKSKFIELLKQREDVDPSYFNLYEDEEIV